MPINTETLNRRLYKVLHQRFKNTTPLDSSGEKTPVEDEADVFKFSFTKNGEEYGTVFATIDDSKKLKIYMGDDVTDSPEAPTPGLGYDDTWFGFLKFLKSWAMQNQLGWDIENKDHLEGDMARRDHMKKKESIAEGYYPMGKKASYSDAVPTVKMIIQHNRDIQEGEQRYRNVARIFLENSQGERILAPTTKPGVAKVYARHIAEGGLPNDERWNHIKGLCEEYNKMAGFVRATRGQQFNESAQQLVESGIQHYNKLRESLSKMTGHRGYNMYFESWTPPLMEDDADTSNLNELFVQETLDPRIESVMPILSKLHKNVAEMREVGALAEWADSLLEGGDGGEASEEEDGDTAGDAGEGGAEDAPKDDLDEAAGAETLAHNQATEKSRLDAFDLDEGDGGQQALNPQGIPEGFDDDSSPVASAITRRILMQRPDLLQKFGPVKVLQAINDVADFVGDTDEIGSSDVSGWIKQVEQSLGGIDEGIIDKIKDVGQKALDKLGHGSDDDLLKKLQKDAGIPAQHGKPNMAKPKEEEVDESALQAYLGDKKYGKDGMDALRKAGRDGASKEKMASIRAKYDKLDEEGVAEGLDPVKKERLNDLIDLYSEVTDPEAVLDFEVEPEDIIGAIRKEFGDKTADSVQNGPSMHFPRPGHSMGHDDLEFKQMRKNMSPNRITKLGKLHKQDSDAMKRDIKSKLDVEEGLDANQKRVGQLGPTEKVKNNNIGKLVGANESFINTDAQAVVSEMDKSEDKKGPEGKATPITPKKMADDAKKVLDKKNVKEGQDELDAIKRLLGK